MKNQYVGDVNDYCKYGLPRVLADRVHCRLGVCWMLTKGDGRQDGRKVEYLKSAVKWRDHDPELFDLLRRCASNGDERRIETIEQSGCLPCDLFHSTELSDNRERRLSYFQEAEVRLALAHLVFFDPDNGLEVRSCRVGNKNSCKYLYWTELEKFFSSGKSVIVFQHFNQNEKHSQTVTRLLNELGCDLPPVPYSPFRHPTSSSS